MPRVTGQTEEGIQSVLLAFRLVEHLVTAGRPVGVTALATALGTTKSRIYRHLQTLMAAGYLRQEPETERYMIGPGLVRIGRSVSQNIDLLTLAMPILRELRDELGHYTVISEMEPDGLRVLAAVSGRSAIEIGVKAGSLLPLHASAQGKVGLAFSDPAVMAQLERGRFELLTPHTIVSAAQLEVEVEKIRQRGWATAPNEILIGLNTLAAPIFGADKQLVAVIGIVDSIQYIDAMPSAEQIRRTLGAAQQISELLGYSSAAPVHP
jgi:IclR family KDG regulon transcriptional repressor